MRVLLDVANHRADATLIARGGPRWRGRTPGDAAEHRLGEAHGRDLRRSRIAFVELALDRRQRGDQFTQRRQHRCRQTKAGTSGRCRDLSEVLAVEMHGQAPIAAAVRMPAFETAADIAEQNRTWIKQRAAAAAAVLEAAGEHDAETDIAVALLERAVVRTLRADDFAGVPARAASAHARADRGRRRSVAGG